MNKSPDFTDPEVNTLAELQAKSVNLLNAIYGPEARQLVKLLFCFFTGLQTYQLIARQHEEIDASVRMQILNAVAELLNYKPIQYILGTTEFAGLLLRTDSRALIPRPETEELVEWILEDWQSSGQTHSTISILDVATGSGAIALALKAKIHQATVHALDISEEALHLAQLNSRLLHLDVNFLKQDILKAITDFAAESLDLIVSNPPYILQAEQHSMKQNVLAYEPHLALFVPDGEAMKFYRPIAEFAVRTLKTKGFLYLEINETCAGECEETMLGAGLVNINFRNDMQGKTRMMRAEKQIK